MGFTEDLIHQIPTILWANSSMICYGKPHGFDQWLILEQKVQQVVAYGNKNDEEAVIRYNGMGCKMNFHASGQTEFPYLTEKVDPHHPKPKIVLWDLLFVWKKVPDWENLLKTKW